VTTEHVVETGRIVVGLDGSPSSLAALRWAGRQAELTHSILDVIMTWDWPPTYGWAAPFPTGYDPEEGVHKVLDEAVADLRTTFSSLDITAKVMRGHPFPLLVEASKGADLLVVGSRGHGEFAGMLIGSVSEFCATNAHCPVLVHRAVS
jgi:nucleotide-binding universal stress UspA family protein